MSIGSRTSYNCPYKTKRLTGRGHAAIEWCTLVHKPCKYRPHNCPHRRAIENYRIVDFCR